jgi:hypothetical protein
MVGILKKQAPNAKQDVSHLTRRGKKDFLLAIKISFSVEKPEVVKNYTLQFSSKELALD